MGVGGPRVLASEGVAEWELMQQCQGEYEGQCPV